MKAQVKITVKCPKECSEKQFLEWLRAELGLIPTNTKNPLFFSDLRGNITEESIKVEK